MYNTLLLLAVNILMLLLNLTGVIFGHNRLLIIALALNIISIRFNFQTLSLQRQLPTLRLYQEDVKEHSKKESS